MPVPGINLDDKTFDELLKESMARIPIYSPSWTNRNLADPGITLLELITWLAEMQIYSLNRLPKKNYLAYLRLLGIKPIPATPPKLIITFVNKGPPLFLKNGSLLKVDTPENDIYFETDDDITIMPVSIQKVIQYSNFRFTLLDANSISDPINTSTSTSSTEYLQYKQMSHYFFAFGDYPNLGNSFYLGLNFDDNIVADGAIEGNTSEEDTRPLHRLFLYIHLYELGLPEVGSHGNEKVEEFQKSDQKSKKIQWEYLASEDNGTRKIWKSFTTIGDEFADHTKELTRSGTISFKIPFKVIDRQSIESFRILNQIRDKSDAENFDEFRLYWIRCKVISTSNYEITPRISHILPNTVSATFGRTMEDYMHNRESYTNDISIGLKESNGLPNQSFQIKKENLPIISIISLEVVSENFSEKWHEIDDYFNSSRPNDTHFQFDKLSGIISFGDGSRGQIPSKGSKIRIKVRSGITGDVLTRQNSFFQVYDGEKNNNILLSRVTATNLFPPSGGTAGETIDDAIVRLRRNSKIPFKAVSSSDFEYIAKSTPGLRVARSKAIPCYQDKVNFVLVIVVPYSLLKNPIPSPEFLQSISNHLHKHRLITTRLSVCGPNYIGVRVSAHITINPTSNSQRILNEITEKLKNFLSPLPIDEKNMGWEFGSGVYRSDIYHIIDSVNGVNCVIKLSLSATGEFGTFSYDDNNNIIISNTSITYLEIFSASTSMESDLCKSTNSCHDDNNLSELEQIPKGRNENE